MAQLVFSLSFLAAALCLLLVMVAARDDDQHKVGNLLRHLLEDYSKHDLPAGQPVMVTHGIELLRIKELDVEEQKMDTVVFETWIWRDGRLAWSSNEHGDLKTIRVPTKFLWLPDIELFNPNEKPELMADTLAVVSSTGDVTLVQPKVISTMCNSTQHACTQTCTLIFGSWTYDATGIDMKAMSGEAGHDFYLPNPKWNLVSTSAERHSKTYPCCPEHYVSVTYTLNVECKNKYKYSKVVGDDDA